MAGIKDIKFLTRPVQKFQAGGTAGVLDFDAIPEIMDNIKRPNLMGDPTKIGLESLGPLFAMAAAGAYPAVSALTEAEARDRGIIQPPDELTEEEKEVFKTATEINQIYLVEHAHMRQEYVCQSQSVNLFFTMPKATESQSVHDEYLQYVNDVHWYAMNKLKSLYYFRSDAARNAENVNVKVQRVKLEDVECLSCEG